MGTNTSIVAVRMVLAAVVTAVCAWSLPSQAGLIRDKLRERAEQRREAAQHQDDEMGDGMHASGEAALPPGVTLERDIAYGSDPAQRLDLFRPAKVAPDAVLIFMVHGGGWARGDKAYARVTTNKVPHWVPQGHVFVSINYRMVPVANPVEQADDVARALAFVQGQAASWGVNPARVVLMGHSAGAHLVSMLNADPSIATRQGARPWLGTVPLDGAAFDVVTIMEARHFRLFDKTFGTDRALWVDASPIRRLKAAPPPMLLVCSARRADSCAQAQAFMDKANGLGGRVQLQKEDLSHSEINERLGLPGAYTDSVDAFIRQVSAR
ncbi:alpha/beta hydrolase [Piscinibacter terrae]|uniref:Alpha/beta hydrolase n=1 Tax=Piscinibacter terrae TaxID=2496871 RepID=A0A3N7HP75_9BURK|nr:alpha/beta hydrolase [Albitalea terrae]RQP23493.1 alpha/beta hydrolase [Albitalea terrae]